MFMLLFALTVEVGLGKWWSNTPAYEIPFTIVNKKIKYDGSKIYGPAENSLINYTRDKNGYRSHANTSAINQVLTIGGSTTDQRYVADGETFQDIMNVRLGKSYSVINGGVDGQTSYGHLISIKDWHSKVLDKNKIKKVILYLGINDISLLKGVEDGLKTRWKSRTFMNKIRSTRIWQLSSRRSFFISRIRQLRLKFIKQEAADGIKTIGHGTNNPNFKSDNQLNDYQRITLDGISREYIYLIKNLIQLTHQSFPLSDIFLVQQQDPKCSYNDEYNTVERAIIDKFKSYTIIDYCKLLGKVYLAQDETVKLFKNTKLSDKIKIVKMYVDEPLPNNAFYDGAHTNSYGSRLIANYLLENIDF